MMLSLSSRRHLMRRRDLQSNPFLGLSCSDLPLYCCALSISCTQTKQLQHCVKCRSSFQYWSKMTSPAAAAAKIGLGKETLQQAAKYTAGTFVCGQCHVQVPEHTRFLVGLVSLGGVDLRRLASGSPRSPIMASTLSMHTPPQADDVIQASEMQAASNMCCDLNKSVLNHASMRACLSSNPIRHTS